MSDDAANRQFIAAINGQIATLSGRRYAIKLEALDAASLRELLRLLRDLEYEKMSAVRRAKTMPWRR